MAPGAYPAARIVAPRIEVHFKRHLDGARLRDGRLALAPDADAVEAMVDAAFWASLRREETYLPRISLAFLSPAQTEHPMRFDRPLPLTAAALAKVAPAVERPGIHLAVWRNDGELRVWGTTRAIPDYCFVLEVAAPGLLVVKHRHGDQAGKFVNVAVLQGDEVKVVDERASSLPDCPPLLSAMLGFDSSASWVDSVNVLVQLAVSMRAHGRGGLLLVVPSGADGWRESIVKPVSYALDPPNGELAFLMSQPPDERDPQAWRESLERAVSAIAGVTAVDGAAVMTAGYELLGFGAKIARRRGSPQVDRVTLTEPIEGDVPSVVDPSALGGTRHLSAAQFVQDQSDSVALVASQDGRFTVFAWSPCDGMVHAHRVEVLLM
jgi:hypothetical protein